MSPGETTTALLTVDYPASPYDAGWDGPDYTFTNGASAGAHVFSSAPGRLVLGRSNYIGVAGDWRTVATLGSDYRGLMYYKSKNALAKVPDGTSNTWLFGEMCGGWIAWNGGGGIPDGVACPSWVSGFNYTAFGLSSTTAQDQSADIGNSWALFGSLHSGLTNFGYADGSIRPLRDPGNLPFALVLALSGFQDGVTVSQN